MWPRRLQVRGAHRHFPDSNGKLLPHAATVLPPQLFLDSPLLCVSLYVSPPLSLFLISLCQHIPQKPSPVSAFWTFLLDGKTEKRERERKKGLLLEYVSVGQPNRLHMLVVMAEDVADVLCSLIILFPPPSQTSSPISLSNYPSLFSLWIPFLLFIVLYFVLASPLPWHSGQIRLSWRIAASRSGFKSEVGSLCGDVVT